MFRGNAFRITGLPVDATPREITKHADKIKMMEELGQGKSVHTGAFALTTPPTVDQIREAIQRLKDPEQRIIDEFFWFWPRQFGQSASDSAIKALEGGDADTAFDIWTALETSPSDGHVAMHNIAVLRHLMALEWENHYTKTGKFTSEKKTEIEKLWRGAFKRWNLLAVDDLFWESVTARIKQLDDPRLTSGFTRRMRATLPHALDKINAELAVRYAESGRMDMARVHVQFMRETNQGLDNIEKTAELVLTPASTRLKQQIQRAKERDANSPNGTVDAVRELLDHARRTLSLFELFFGKESEARNDLSDEVATLCNRLQLDYHKATSDDQTCLATLRAILPFAVSPDLRQLIERNISVTLAKVALAPIRAICEEAATAVEANPASGEKEAHRILCATSPLLPQLSSSGLSQESINRAKDEIAIALLNCAVAFGNKTDNWKPCVSILEESLQLAVDSDVKERVTRNLDTVRKNNTLYGDLLPISSAPSLSTTNGVGFALYGCTDQEPTSGSHLSTYYFVFFWIPVFPICRYRVASTGNGYRFFGKAPLRTFDKWHLVISIGLIIWLVIAISSASNNPNRDSYTPSPSVSVPAPRLTDAPTPPTPRNYTIPSTSTAPQSFTAPSSSGTSDRGTYRVPSYISEELERDSLAIESEKAKAVGLEHRLDNAKRTLDAEQAKAEEFENQVTQLNAQVDSARRYLDRSSQVDVDDFNRKVNRYNAALATVRAQNEKTNRAVDSYNSILEEVRAQNRAVNQLVDDYNTKLRRNGR
ncbi:MAG: hypothetical protein WDN28_30940 [Chthoniobacter sp.]